MKAAMEKDGVHVDIHIETTLEFLESNNLSLEDVKGHVSSLMKLFGTLYLDLFPTEVKTNDINHLVYVNRTLSKLKDLKGFNRHIKCYNQKEFDSHFYTATVALFLKKLGYEIEMEPDMGSTAGPHPDLRIERGSESCYIECKTSEIKNFYNRDHKKAVADYIYQIVNTCDQINITFRKPIDLNEVHDLFNQTLVRRIYMAKFQTPGDREHRIQVSKDIEILIIFQPPIIGTEEDFLEIEVGGMLIDEASLNKSIGIQFLKGGRSIGVYEVVNFKNKLKKKRLKSTNQLVDGFSNITFIKDSNVLGDAAINMKYMESTWLTADNHPCSGIAFFDTFKKPDGSGETDNLFRFVPNPHASKPFVVS